jgi:hypothetical protein
VVASRHQATRRPDTDHNGAPRWSCLPQISGKPDQRVTSPSAPACRSSRTERPLRAGTQQLLSANEKSPSHPSRSRRSDQMLRVGNDTTGRRTRTGAVPVTMLSVGCKILVVAWRGCTIDNDTLDQVHQICIAMTILSSDEDRDKNADKIAPRCCS